jgi:hypothetical protein
VLDEGRCFGRQVVESIELLAMQGCEAVDERGRGGYPVYGRIFLDSSRYALDGPHVWHVCAVC